MADKPKFNPRKMMEKAIEVMRRSVGESRDDGKPNPLVGAVLVRPDGSTETACRGELRDGNHAEFTLLERKCIGEKLDDCVLFATLEPCLNRNHPKRGCARHIVSARIKKVYVGIEDDNPTVAGKGIQLLPSGFGYLLFGKDPRLPMPQAGLLARAELPDGTAERKEFSLAMVLIPGELEKWLNKILPHTLDRGQMERIERIDLPFEMIREAVVNALIHRDYDIKGQKCQLVVSPSTITISSPGGPIPPISMEQMRSFRAPMKSRNPILHFVFARMGMAEEQGYGLQSLKQQAEKLGLPLPNYSMEGDSLVLTIYRTVEAITASLAEDVRESLSGAERKGLEFTMSRTRTTQSEYAKELEVTARTAQRHLTHFVELGLLKRIGKGPPTEYRKP